MTENQDPIPVSKQAHQIPPGTGKLQIFLTTWLGPSYRTGLAGIATGIGIAVEGITQGMPTLMATGHIVKGELFRAVIAFLVAGGITKIGLAAKDKSVTGVEK